MHNETATETDPSLRIAVSPDRRAKRGPSLALLRTSGRQQELAGRLRQTTQAGHASRRAIQVLLLACGDALALVLSLAVGYAAWAAPVLGQSVGVYTAALPFLPLFLVGYATAGLYPGYGVGAVRTLRYLISRTASIALLLAAASAVLHWPLPHSRLSLAVALLTSFAAVPLTRFVLVKVASPWPFWGEPTVVVGTGEMARRTTQAALTAPALGYRPVAAVAIREPTSLGELCGIPVMGGLGILPELARRGIRVALLADHDEPLHDIAILNYLQEHFRHVIAIRDCEDVRVDGIQVRNLGGVLGLEYTNELLKGYNRAVKRGLDLVLGSLLLVLSAPLITLCAVAIRLASPGCPFYSQEREGHLGKRIRVWKLRTMHADAEERLRDYLRESPAARQEWEERFKLVRDPRIVPLVGHLLRRLSLDEIPQLWNVVRGDMSLVGPRPFPEYHLRKFPRGFRELRRCVRPGLSGLWQVMVRSDGGIREQQAYDTYYIRNWSVWMDAYILAKTGTAVLLGRGAR